MLLASMQNLSQGFIFIISLVVFFYGDHSSVRGWEGWSALAAILGATGGLGGLEEKAAVALLGGVLRGMLRLLLLLLVLLLLLNVGLNHGTDPALRGLEGEEIR